MLPKAVVEKPDIGWSLGSLITTFVPFHSGTKIAFKMAAFLATSH